MFNRSEEICADLVGFCNVCFAGAPRFGSKVRQFANADKIPAHRCAGFPDIDAMEVA